MSGEIGLSAQTLTCQAPTHAGFFRVWVWFTPVKIRAPQEKRYAPFSNGRIIFLRASFPTSSSSYQTSASLRIFLVLSDGCLEGDSLEADKKTPTTPEVNLKCRHEHIIMKI